MLGYISSTRKKSCYACVKAKRRCDLGYPFCKRCFVKGLDCKYPNAQKAAVSARDAEVIIRQSTPDFTLPAVSVGGDASSANKPPALAIDAAIDVNIGPQSLHWSGSSSDSSESSPENFSSNDWRSDWTLDLEAFRNRSDHAARVCIPILPQIWEPSALNQGQVVAVLQGLCAFVPELAFSGATQFLHRTLYREYQPQAYQDSVALAALYMIKNPSTQPVLANSINSKILALTANSSSWTLTEHLAAVQALIIYQIIRLFDPDLNLQDQAEKHNALLEVWSAHLMTRFFNERQPFQDGHESWVYNESVRRTIMISVFVRCAWSCLTQGGIAEQVPVLVRLPFSKDTGAWQCDSEGWNRRTIPYITEEENLISYAELSNTWTYDSEVATLDPFGKLLLAACRGADDPRLLE